MNIPKNLSVAFFGGVIGAIVCSVFLWVIVRYNITADINVSFPLPTRSRDLTAVLYQQMVFGGLWGILFIFPILKSSWWKRALVIGLLPSLCLFLYIFPHLRGAGYFGVNYGVLTFIPVLITNWIWGLVTALWYHQVAR